jgi:protein-S-isoprenylcysteine O-methyltransferase Ste14
MWVFSAYLIYTNRIFLLGFHIDFPLTIRVLGAFFAGAGIFLQLWTLKVLTARVITGVPELISGEKASLVIKGPFSFMRHPTYVSHTIFLVGVLLTTGVVSIGIVVIIDFFVVTLIIIPLEENDLLQRFGDEYSQYMSHTPGLFPRIEWKKLTGNKTNPTNSVNSSKLA